MEENNQERAVVLTAEELELLSEARAARAAKAEAARRAADVAAYKTMVDDAIVSTLAEAHRLRAEMERVKNAIVERFQSVIDLKNSLYSDSKKHTPDRFTDTFTNGDSTARVTLGYNTVDAYDDTYTSGVAKVRDYILSLASDAKSEQLAAMVETLLSERSKSGQLKAQNVLRLEKLANEIGDEQFILGMRIIREAYRPQKTRVFVKVECRNAQTNAWEPIPLNMTNV